MLTEALIFKLAAARFLDVFEEETNKLIENTFALKITRVIILKQIFSSNTRVPSTTSLGLFDNIHFDSSSANNC